MVNQCTIPISTGMNKGKLCKDINKYCRHKPCKCDYCGEIFSHISSMERHKQKKHLPKSTASTPKPQVTIKPKTTNDSYNKLQEEMHTLKNNFEEINARIKKVEQEPKNIIIIGDEKIFESLTRKFGSDEIAMQFLLEHTQPENSIDIVDKLYLEGVAKDQYPIACTDDYRFRYLNRSGKIVDDHGGQTIVTKLESEIHNALMEANTKLLNNISSRKVYNIYDLNEQINGYRELNDRNKFRDDLAKKVYNKQHPFFA